MAVIVSVSSSTLLEGWLPRVDVTEVHDSAGGFAYFIRDRIAGFASSPLAHRIVLAGLPGANGGRALPVQEACAVEAAAGLEGWVIRLGLDVNRDILGGIAECVH